MDSNKSETAQVNPKKQASAMEEEVMKKRFLLVGHLARNGKETLEEMGFEVTVCPTVELLKLMMAADNTNKEKCDYVITQFQEIKEIEELKEIVGPDPKMLCIVTKTLEPIGHDAIVEQEAARLGVTMVYPPLCEKYLQDFIHQRALVIA